MRLLTPISDPSTPPQNEGCLVFLKLEIPFTTLKILPFGSFTKKDFSPLGATFNSPIISAPFFLKKSYDSETSRDLILQE